MSLQADTEIIGVDVLLAFWGKAHPKDDAPVAMHPLLYHALDVAAVCNRLLALYPAVARTVAEKAGCAMAEAQAFLTFLVALHDIGKVAPGFQAKAPQHFPAVFGPPPEAVAGGDHTACGVVLLADLLLDPLLAIAPAVTEYAWPILTATVAGHHGRPAKDVDKTPPLTHVVPYARCYLAACAHLFLPAPFSGRLTESSAKEVSWGLAGLCMVSDWIGSNQGWFPYQAPTISPQEYWQTIAVPAAARAIAAAGLEPLPPAAQATFAALTGRADPPTPLQALAETVSLPDRGPALILIEDVTGAGKTEAALILAVRLMQKGFSQGVYFAMPTMATANAMYRRLDGLAPALFAIGADAAVMLSHGARHLDERFMAQWQGDGEEPGPDHRPQDDSTLTASSASTRWLADDRRKAFFAPLGAGTIDQAFLGVLPAKFGPLRLAGLSGRTLVVDEAHAYDAYCVEELKTLIRFQAALGGSTIILSATLSSALKADLFDAFRLGCGNPKLTKEQKRAASPLAYPLLTCLGAGASPVTHAVETVARLCRSVTVQPVDDEGAAISLILDAVARGAAVAWIRNTVEDVLAAAARLRQAGVDAMTFHARFAMIDRQRREQDVLDRFGPTGQGRDGRVLVASQVIEQSLDVDFDVVVTDLAPVDLLIQRAGRLWRHERPRPVEERRLYVLSPTPTAQADAQWYARLFPRAAHVYKDHSILWLSAVALFGAGALVTPGGVRPLIEAVYGPQADAAAPTGLSRLRMNAEGQAQADRSFARQLLLDFAQGYPSGVWVTDTAIPTRLGEEQTVFRLARYEGGDLVPYAQPAPWPGESPRSLRARAWALSEVSVRAGRASGRQDPDTDWEGKAKELEARWAEIGVRAVVLPLHEQGAGEYRAYAVRSDRRDQTGSGQSVPLFYTPERGLSFLPAENDEGVSLVHNA